MKFLTLLVHLSTESECADMILGAELVDDRINEIVGWPWQNLA